MIDGYALSLAAGDCLLIAPHNHPDGTPERVLYAGSLDGCRAYCDRTGLRLGVIVYVLAVEVRERACGKMMIDLKSDGPLQQQVCAFSDPTAPLVVTEAWPPAIGYTITHAPTGRALGKNRTLARARALCAALLALTDWTRSLDELRADADLMVAARRAWEMHPENMGEVEEEGRRGPVPQG